MRIGNFFYENQKSAEIADCFFLIDKKEADSGLRIRITIPDEFNINLNETVVLNKVAKQAGWPFHIGFVATLPDVVQFQFHFGK